MKEAALESEKDSDTAFHCQSRKDEYLKMEFYKKEFLENN